MKIFIIALISLLTASVCNAQLVITNEPSALALAQKLVGEGVVISNVTFTGNSLMAGLFKNNGGTNINIDSGIVLTSGRAKSALPFDIALDGDGTDPANFNLASTDWGLPGDVNLAAAIGVPVADMEDACVLEFDFVPSGDTVKFNYIFSSEEYDPTFACSEFIDAFAFFISGPGIVGQQNIALVPGTNLPVSIFNINNVIEFGNPLCPQNPSYYLDNSGNTYFTHDGHTVLLTAVSQVEPCNVYHLKMVISDNSDDLYDSGVFLEAKSLSSNIVTLTNNTQTDVSDNSYIVEGCITGSFTIKRPNAADYPLNVRLSYTGTAVNGVDVQLLPDVVVIPANDSDIVVNVIPIIDNIPEGIEYFKIFAISGCGSTVPIDSTVIQIRDYDTLGILPDTAIICKNSSIQITASAGNTTYQWNAVPGLNNYAISNPVATPVSGNVTYTCTAQLGTCNSRDSVFLQWKELELISVRHVNCQGAATGQIIVSGGSEWTAPVQYSINNQSPQANGIFNNLPVGNYIIRVKDASTCLDSVIVDINQAFPNLLITDTVITAATCTGTADGKIIVTASGGKPPYRYSSNGTTFQASNILPVRTGIYSITVKDNNGCIKVMEGVNVPFINSVTLSTGAAPVICESKSTILPATANATTVSWSPTATLNNPALLNPTADPVITTMYTITATTGICIKKDSVQVIVNPAPAPDAGANDTICFGGEGQLSGSGGVDYIWTPDRYLSDPGIRNPVVSQASTITYYLEVIDANGCKSLSKDAVVITVPPPAKLFAGWDTAVAIKQPLQLLATDVNHIGFINYSWEPGGGLNNPLIRNPIAVLTAAETQFIVTASTAANCVGKDTVYVKTYKGPDIYVANIFTPNGDGTNDILKAFPVGIRSFSYFNIYNRYGQLVFSTTNEDTGWDGRYKGAVQNLGTFVWIAAAVDYKGNVLQRKGTTTIIQ
jgi:gliding motility-associated-like protein